MHGDLSESYLDIVLDVRRDACLNVCIVCLSVGNLDV